MHQNVWLSRAYIPQNDTYGNMENCCGRCRKLLNPKHNLVPLTTRRFITTFLSLKIPSMLTLQQYGPLSVRLTLRIDRSICPSSMSPVNLYLSVTWGQRHGCTHFTLLIQLLRAGLVHHAYCWEGPSIWLYYCWLGRLCSPLCIDQNISNNGGR